MKSQTWLRLSGAWLVWMALAGVGCGGGGGAGDEEAVGFEIAVLSPADGANKVSQDVAVRIELTEAIDDVTIVSALDFVRVEDGEPVPVFMRRPTSKVILLDPIDRLDLATVYRVTVAPTLRSQSGELLEEGGETTFSTVQQATPKIPKAHDFLGLSNAMSRGRSQHTANRLDEGTVLVAGGFSSASSTTDTADVYDPETRSFTPTLNTMSDARARHTATKLLDGRILIVGGLTGAGNVAIRGCELYDPESNVFSPAPSLGISRAYHTATMLGDGRVLVCGGSTTLGPGTFQDLGTAEIYDPATETWSAPIGMLRTRAFHTATELEDGRVLVAGGAADGVAGLFDPESNSFSPTGEAMKARRSGHTAALLETGNVLFSGGGHDRGEVYLAAAESFVEITNLTADRYFATATPVPEGGILVLGGILFGDQETFLLGTMELFAARIGSFGSFFNVGHQLNGPPRAGHTATVLEDGSILVTGGINTDASEPELDSGFTYDPN